MMKILLPAIDAAFRSMYMSRYSFFFTFSTSRTGAEYFAETTSSCAPWKYNAATKVLGSAGSAAAMLSSFKRSSVSLNSLAAAADFESSAARENGEEARTQRASTGNTGRTRRDTGCGMGLPRKECPSSTTRKHDRSTFSGNYGYVVAVGVKAEASAACSLGRRTGVRVLRLRQRHGERRW